MTAFSAFRWARTGYYAAKKIDAGDPTTSIFVVLARGIWFTVKFAVACVLFWLVAVAWMVMG